MKLRIISALGAFCKKVAIVTTAALLCASPAFAEWWALKSDGSCDNHFRFPSPASVYEDAKKAGFAPQIEDFGDGEVVVHMIVDGAPVNWTYFNTLQACRKRQDEIANGTFNSDKGMLEKYR